MHIFLTGTVQIGKTTVIDKTLALLGVTAGGFRSYFGADRHCPSHHYLYMSSAANRAPSPRSMPLWNSERTPME